MAQNRQLTPSRLSATGTSATATPRMTSCSLSWRNLPDSTTKSSPFPLPPAVSGQAPCACSQVWTGAKTTTVSVPPTANQKRSIVSTQLGREERRMGRDHEWSSKKRPTLKSKAPPFPGWWHTTTSLRLQVLKPPGHLTLRRGHTIPVRHNCH